MVDKKVVLAFIKLLIFEAEKITKRLEEDSWRSRFETNTSPVSVTAFYPTHFLVKSTMSFV
jgi:hypothetical protein